MHAGLCHIASNTNGIIQVVLTMLFAIDQAVTFNVAVFLEAEAVWILDRKKIASIYLWYRYSPPVCYSHSCPSFSFSGGKSM
jgi:hypothetical protein